MRAATVLLVLAAAAAVLAAPAPRVTISAPAYDCQYTREATPLAAELLAQTSTQLRIVLPARNMDELKAIVLDRADPASPNYAKWLSLAEIDALTLPAQIHFGTVIHWLQAEGITTFNVERDSVTVDLTLATASRVFRTQFFRVSHNSGRAPTVIRAGDYSLPAHVEASIAAIFGLHGVPLATQDTLVGAGPATVTPTVIHQTYGVGGVTVNPSTNNTQSVGEFQGQYMNKADLVKFFANEVPNATAGADQVYQFIGEPYTAGYGVEAELDIEFIMGVAPSVKTQFWEWPNNDFCGDLKAYTAHMLTADTPNVNSISYGWQGDLSGIGCTTAQTVAVDNNFAKLAALGVSVIIASGDSGSGYGGSSTCNTVEAGAELLWPSWPASSPWVTAVGATRFINQKIAANNEMASDQFGSGGGFSYMFNASSYQRIAVNHYVAMGSTLPKFPTAGTFPPHGRATPDVSALGEGFKVYTEGIPQPVGGTSASTPTFAALVSLINEARIQAGKPAMGFLNPFLYQCGPTCFFDVTTGTNAINRSGLPVPKGYAAAAGWDAATGLGTPKFAALLAAALAA